MELTRTVILAYFINCRWNAKVLKNGLVVIAIFIVLAAFNTPKLFIGIFFILIGYVSMVVFLNVQNNVN